MPEDEEKKPGNPLAALEKKVGHQPWYVWAGALTGGGIVVWYVLKNRATATATAATNTQPATSNAALNGYDVSSLAGMPYGQEGYSPGSGPMDNYPNSSGFPEVQSGTSTVPYLPPGVVPIFDSNGNLIGYQPSTPTTPTTPTPTTPTPQGPNHPPTTGLLGANVLVRDAKGVWEYEKKGSKSWLPINLPKGTTFAPGSQGRWWYVEPGSDIQYLLTSGTGPPVTNSGYPVNSVGYNTGSGGAPSQWQHHLNQGRNTIDQHAEAMGLLN